MINQRRLAVALVAIVAAIATTLGSFVPVAQAQTQVVGTADFRNAPQLPPGQYLDRIVTGDSAWYAIIYTNDTPYEFSVDFQGAAPTRGVDLSVSFVAPTLTTVDGPSSLVAGSGVAYPAGHTNVWFLKVSLATSDQVGVEYPVVISVDGVQSVGIEDCADVADCTLDDEYAAINVELAQARAELEEARAQETLASVQAEIENLQGFADTSATLGPAARARLVQAEARMAELCAPDPICEEFPDPGTKTPIVGWAIGLAALGFGAFRAFKKFTGDDTPPEPPARRPISSSVKAR